MNTSRISLGVALVLLAVGFGAVRALGIDSAGSGYWTNGSTWVGGVVPTIADTATILNGHTVTNSTNVAISVGSLTIQTNGVLTHTANSTTAAGEKYKVILNVAGNLTIDLGGQINVDGKGYSAGNGLGYEGSYGGCGWAGGATYGSITAPTNLGSGGLSSAGGGAVILTVTGTTTVNGAISASGGDSNYRLGSGGSVFLTTGALTGNGTLKADGGKSSTAQYMSGGGGRVAVILTNSTDFGAVKMQAYAGTPDSDAGAGGTVYLQNTNHAPGNGKLIVNWNNIVNTMGRTTLQNGVAASSNAFSEIILTNGAVYRLDTNDTLDITGTTIRGDPTKVTDGIYLAGGTLMFPADLNFSNYSYCFIEIATTNTPFNPTSLTVNNNSMLKIDVPWTLNCPVTMAAGGVVNHTGNITNYPAVTNLTINGNVDIQTNGTITVNSTVINGNLNIQTNGILNHNANGGSEIYKVILNVASNLTIDAGGQINVDGKGYALGYGPGKPLAANASGSYGGKGVRNDANGIPGPTYGSITAPTNLGSSGNNGPGGGAAIVTVTGTTTVNGAISASGNPGNFAPGSGGSIFLTTGTLTGNGTIKANGGSASLYCTGGGGRIAVVLTNSTDFGAVKMQAYAGNLYTPLGAPGTIYLQTQAQSPGQGTLVIDASNIVASYAESTTLISSQVTDTVVGTVIITNKAVLQIDTNQSLTVNGSWTNAATFIANSNSTVTFASANTATVAGSNTFYNLTCSNANKTVLFTAGTTNFVNGNLTLGPKVTLLSTVPGTWWYLTLATNGTQQVQGVRVQDSNAGGGQTITVIKNSGAVDLRHNVNWNLPPPGTMFTFH